MERRLTIIVAIACLVGVLGLMVLQPPATSAVSTPRLEPSQRFAELLQIRARRDLTPGEEREMRELRLQLLHNLRHYVRNHPEQQPWQ
jgi:hypothetical protein